MFSSIPYSVQVSWNKRLSFLNYDTGDETFDTRKDCCRKRLSSGIKHHHCGSKMMVKENKYGVGKVSVGKKVTLNTGVTLNF